MAGKPKLICFDWDGTLIDSFNKIAIVIAKTAENLGYKTVSKANIKRKIGLSLEQILSELYGQVQVQDFIDEYHFIYHTLPPPDLYPGCVRLLKSLHDEGIMTAIVTNKSRSSTETELEAHHLSHLIGSIWVAEELVPKPSPVMLLHCASSHQLSLNELWMVGDSLPDMYAASAAGVDRIILVEDLPVPASIDNVHKIKSLNGLLDMLSHAVYQ